MLTAFVIYGAFAEIDMSNVTTIASLSWAEVAASNVWYYKKAAVENKLKIAKSLPDEIKEQIDMNQLLNQ